MGLKIPNIMHTKTSVIDGDARRFLLINTTDYNGDHEYGARDVSMADLPDYGVDDELDLKNANELKVGGIFRLDIGVYLMRVA